MEEAGTSRRIDKLLELSTAGWEEIPELSRDVATWDFDSRLTYLAERPLEEDRLARLARFADGGRMNANQMDRYRELLRLLQENRPLLNFRARSGRAGRTFS